MLLLPFLACVRPPVASAPPLERQSPPRVETRTERPAARPPSPTVDSPNSSPSSPVVDLAPPKDPAWKTLQNGARLQLLPDRLVGTVAIQLWVSGGVSSEPGRGLGLSHLTERLLLHELAKAPSDKIRAVGGEVTAFTTLDHTVFHLLLPRSEQALALDFLAAIFDPKLTFDDAMVARQLEQAAQEQKRSQLVLRSVAVEKLRELSFPGHPYARPLLGTTEQLRSLRRDDVQAFYRQTYRPDHLTVLACGALADSLSHPLTSLFAGLPGQSDSAADPTSPTPPITRASGPQVAVALHEDPALQAVVGFALPGVAASEPEAAAFDVWAQLVRSGRNVKSLASRAAAEATALSFSGRAAGLLIAYATVPPAQIEDATTKLLTELFRPTLRELEAGELLRAKEQLLGETAILVDTPSGRARRTGYFASLGLREDRYRQALQDLTEASLRQTLLRHLRRESLQGLWLLPRSRNPREEAAQLERSRSRLLALLRTPPQNPARPLVLDRSDGGVFRYQVPSGPLVLVLPDHGVEVVAAAASWPGGLSLEDEQTAGGHALLSRLWKDTPRGRNGAWVDSLHQVRATVREQVERDAFSLVGEWPSRAEQEALPLFLDGLLGPEPTEAELERERRQLIAEFRRHDESREAALAKLKARLYGSHPYKLEPSVQSLSGLSRKRLWELLRRAYSPSTMTLAIVGDVEPYAVVSVVESRLQGSIRRDPPTLSALPSIDTPRQYLLYHPHDQALLGIGFRTPGLRAQDAPALLLLSEVLVGKSGRLRRELVERRGLVLSLDGRLETGVHGGALLISASTTPSSLDSAEASLRDELRRLVDHPLSDEELQTAKQQLLAQRSLSRQRRSDVALGLARRTALGLPSHESEDDRLGALTAAQVQAVAQHYLDEQHAVLQAVLPQTLLSAKRGDGNEPKQKSRLVAQLAKASSKSGSGKMVGKKRSRR